MAEIDHEIKVNAPVERVHRALTTTDGLRAWHTPDADGTGAVGTEWRFGYAGRPGFRWRVVASDPTRVAWECTHGPGDAVGTTVSFELAPAADGRTLLTFRHSGWPGTHGNYRKCNTTWGVLLHHLKKYAETDATAHAFLH